MQARERKVLSASRGEEMYTLGKLRHHIKSLSPLRELRPVKDLLAVERVQARERKVLSASRGEEMYTLGKFRHQIKSLSPLSTDTCWNFSLPS